MADDRSNFLNESGKAGLVLAGVAIAYMLISNLISGVLKGGFLSNALAFALWAGKFALCIWLMYKFLLAFALKNDKDRSRTFNYGMMVALCSAVVYAGFYLLYVTVIAPDTISKALDTAVQAYSGMLTSDQIDNIMNMESSLPTIGFFANFIWCWLIGTIISAIVSSNICNKSNPFDE